MPVNIDIHIKNARCSTISGYTNRADMGGCIYWCEVHTVKTV